MKRYYVHGDLHEERRNHYFCFRHDFSFPREHFDDAAHVTARAATYESSLAKWTRFSKAKDLKFYRPTHAENIIAELAAADVKAAEAARSPFHRWLFRQLKRDDLIGDLARDAERDSSFPSTSNSLEALRSHLRRRNAISEARVALEEGWAEFERKGQVRSGVSLAQRFAIFKRDSYRCQVCGISAQDGGRLEIDHKKAVAKNGGNEADNLWTLCFGCNRGKGTHDL